MSVCLCMACSDSPAETYTREFMLECEAREIARMPLKKRQEYLSASAVSGRKQAIERLLIKMWSEKKKETATA